MKLAMTRLRENLDRMSPAEKSAARYILSSPRECCAQSVYQTAEKAFVSPAAVVRMCKQIGFRGYREFRSTLSVEIALKEESLNIPREGLQKDDSLQEVIEKVTYKNIESLAETQRLMDVSVLQKCVDLMRKSDRVLLYGLGASLIAARDMYLKLLRINKECILNEDWHLQLLSARNASASDAAIIFSYSGQTREMITCAKALQDNRTPIIAVTRDVDSPISRMADLELYTTASESLFRSGAMASRISQLNIVDILYTAFANSEYDYSISQYRKTHIAK